jgi:hypothetical protein
VVERETTAHGGRVTVTLCQSTAGGPQSNRRAVFTGTAEMMSLTVWGQALTGRVFTMSSTGTPAAPVRGRVLIGTAPDLAFNAPATSGGWGEIMYA